MNQPQPHTPSPYTPPPAPSAPATAPTAAKPGWETALAQGAKAGGGPYDMLGALLGHALGLGGGLGSKTPPPQGSTLAAQHNPKDPSGAPAAAMKGNDAPAAGSLLAAPPGPNPAYNPAQGTLAPTPPPDPAVTPPPPEAS